MSSVWDFETIASRAARDYADQFHFQRGAGDDAEAYDADYQRAKSEILAVLAVSTPPSEAVAQALAFAIKERDEIRGRYAQTGGSLVRYLGYADACDDIIALLQGEATYSVPAVPVPPTEPETLAPMSPVFEEALTDDEWVERRLAAPKEPEEKR